MEKPNPGTRIPRVENEMTVAYDAGEGFVSAPVVNLSRGGLFINTPRPLPSGTPLRLLLSLPGVEEPFELAAEVRRVNEEASAQAFTQGAGMGVEFLDVDDEKRARIDRLVEHLREELQDGGSTAR